MTFTQISASLLILAVGACASPPAQLTCSDLAACYRPGPDGRLYPVYPPPPVAAHILLITARYNPD